MPDALLSPSELALKSQVFAEASQLAVDLRNYTSKAIVDGNLVLTAGDPKYSSLRKV
ncbi:hypothetical protein [Bordetella ansorpii]|uniref:hypothetical protein n=1 Tax=Bordetella ansorpii TaxID=288768 RepID=UPI000AFAB507|nr:hypothetical protein [Bordetella ansorpii]